MKKIVITPHSVLTKISQPVTFFDQKLNFILEEIKEALLAADKPKGVGLAAPQIGYSLRIFAIKPTEKAKITFFINPKIVKEAPDYLLSTKRKALEGCLSIPNTWGFVKRKVWVQVHFQDAKGQPHLETFRGFPAVIIQHEMDHLNGILFTQRVLEQQGKLYEISQNKNGQEILKELPL